MNVCVCVSVVRSTEQNENQKRNKITERYIKHMQLNKFALCHLEQSNG